MRNVKMVLDGDTLVVRINLKERLGPSATGKTTLVASTGGSIAVPGFPDLKLGINAYVPAGR